MEERLWNYIDGTCSPDERDAITSLIGQDENWQKAHQEMLQFNTEITAITPDEPSMAFGYNVMEEVRHLEASKPLKTTINKYIINGIAAFFALSIIIILIFLLKDSMQSSGTTTTDVNTMFPDMSALMSSSVIKVFFYVDVMLLLFFGDAFLRRKKTGAVPKSV
ncbi:hypothetical protein ACFQZS_13650 [Mucilaginibacter calamicampi]|uniref:DUF1700 domain-containing protein n=1 Tax=Mucilaginibacter calamicampi TaxID=1302352 RepID=A0ABW2Z3C6_9SPHI